jgi:hypothetical protein
METGSHYREPGNRCAMAQIWIRSLLASDLQCSVSERQEENLKTGAGFDLSHVDREPHLGRAAYPRRTQDAWVRCFREDGFPWDATSPNRSRARQAMACVSAESPRFDCRHGFLPRANHNLASSTAFSSSATVAGACSISMLRGILRLLGSFNNCGKHFRFSQRPSFSCLLETPNMGWSSRSRCDQWLSGRFELRSGVLGKTAPGSGGSRVVGATYMIMSLLSISFT